jgi:putative addiction module component (TIGR02574 family)
MVFVPLVGYDRIMTRERLISELMNLPPHERADVARQIISSLDGPSDADAAQAWVQEIERRVREIRDGSVQLADWEDVKARIKARLAAIRS